MLKDKPYERLQKDPVWGDECRIIESLDGASDAYPAVVGGVVRDLLLGRQVKDLDVATAFPDTARDLAREFAKKTGRSFVEYTHKQSIYRVVAPGHPQVDFTDPVGGTRDSDLNRRDFTINALALGLIGNEKGVLMDPAGGAGDLEAGIIRMTSPDVFEDDPLRVLRAFRFSAELGYSIEEKTLSGISEHSNKLANVAGERVQPELLGVLVSDGAAGLIGGMESAGILKALFPELELSKDVEQNTYHHLDVWHHTMDAVNRLGEILRFDDEIFEPYIAKLTEYTGFVYPSGHTRKGLIKLAMLLHDICKPHCKGIRDDGRITFIGHESMGSELVYGYLERLKFPGYERDYVCDLIRGHLRPAILGRDEPDRPRTAYRFFRDYGESALGIILISLADRFAAQGPLVTEKVNRRHREAVAFLLKTLFEQDGIAVRPPQLIDGGVLIRELGIQPGPIIGHLLRRVMEGQVMGEVNNEKEALEYCRKVIEEGEGSVGK